MTRRSACHVRRGGAAIGMVAALTIVQLALVAGVIIGIRSDEAVMRQVESVRAFYAAEAGLHMALRELVTGIDEDGDGTVGTVTLGAGGTSPSLGTARVRVESQDGQGDVVLMSTGRAGDCLQRLVIHAAGGSSGQRAAELLYGSWPEHFPKRRQWMGTQWGPPADTVDFQAPLRWAAITQAPHRDETIFACSTADQQLRAAVGSGPDWHSAMNIAPAHLSVNTRPYWIAYEQKSGRALIVYAHGSASHLRYRIWDGTAWSQQNNVQSPLNGDLSFLRMVPRPGSNEMMVLLSDGHGQMAAMHWDGASWTGSPVLEQNLSSTSYEAVDGAWEMHSSRFVALWGTSSVERPRAAVWDGAAWSSPSNLPAMGTKARWVRVTPDPAGNRILAGFLGENSTLHVAAWNNGTWGGYILMTSSLPTTSSRCFDIAFEPAGTRALIAYAQNSGTPAYRTFDGISWSSAMPGPALASTPNIIQLTPWGNDGDIFLLASLASKALRAAHWDGAAFGQSQLITSDVNGGNIGEVFMVTRSSGSAGGTGPRLSGWARTPPQ